MNVVPLGAESLGVRSMATYVEVAGTGILIDPGATLAPARAGLPPVEEEWEALRRTNDRISAYAQRAAFVFVSHYHEDHFRSDPATYAGRIALVKDPRRMVQGLQARRGAELWKALEPVARVQPADAWSHREGRMALEASPPLAHGVEGTTMGYVLALTVIDEAERERFVFASDVQGPLSPVPTAYLIRQRPTLLYLSGPPSYIERELGAAAIERGVENLLRVIDATGCRVILDHHALRDGRYLARCARLWETGRVVTAAGHLGLEDAALESRRAMLWARARKPAARAGAIMTRTRAEPFRARAISKRAKGGHRE
ncbi:MAG: hypothetical protein HY294_11170 [Candidatus Rokubacteria bacterium]|nr:hypothetical protein [Candidatus Rokubacteria bacterium]